ACASGAVAIAHASRLVASGAVKLAIAGGVDAASRFVHVGFDALGALASGRPKPFRMGRDGLVLGEGAGIVVLAADDDASACRTRGRVLGAGASCDARHITAPDREGAGLADAIRRATHDARDVLDPGRTPYVVHLHGTATPFNDAMEARALGLALGSNGRDAAAYGTKHAIGHTLGASGALETVVTLAALWQRIVPPTASDAPMDPDCAVGISNDLRRSDATVALKLSAAFGGMNCALWLGAAPR
ncbi:MAG: 3-oxoacyl-ACP synthase, partial [Deltaproteobacteria bacterium]|nr:3-oxoacyl-ACP synthase [Deltaproteobacteria bacterium]